jgi:3-phosphoshikimate 1-carboxyvinyltransferase
MRITLKPTQLNGTITIPASKSYMQRAVALAVLNKGVTLINNAGISNDDKAALDIAAQLGAKISVGSYEELTITSKGKIESGQTKKVNVHESGLSTRMFTPIIALAKTPTTITGKGSILKRPMPFFEEVLPQLGVQVKTKKGFLPLTVSGGLIPKSVTVDGSESSQYLTGLLFTYAHAVKREEIITVKNLKSKPYIDVSLNMLNLFGYTVKNLAYKQFVIQPQKPIKRVVEYTVESDWSSASCLISAAAINGNVVLNGVHKNSLQADRKILTAIKKAGVNFVLKDNSLTIKKSNIKAFNFNATHCPDLFPALVALAAFAKGVSKIQGVQRLQYKESNRALALQKEFAKLGCQIKLVGNVMEIKGGAILQGAKVESHNDHRIAMALAAAAVGINDKVTIKDAEAVNKSYPQFWEHLQYLSNSD